MTKFVLTLFAVLATTSVTLAYRPPPPELMDAIKRQELVQTIEGILSGIVKDSNFTNLEECIQDCVVLDGEITRAVKDFESETFDGIKDGIHEIALAIKEIPILVKECKLGEHDLSKLVQMAEIFEHPSQLIYRVGHNLLVNGVEIFHIIEDALGAHSKQNYFDFGYYIGEALDEVFLNQAAHNPTSNVAPQKQVVDEQSFEFMTGYFQGIGLESSHVNLEQLYNTIDHHGAVIYGGPVAGLMKRLQARTNETVGLPIWMSLHEVSHVFQEGEAFLLTNNVITAGQDLETLRKYSLVYEHAPENAQKYSEDVRIATILQQCLTSYQAGDARQVGGAIGHIAYLIYSD